MKQLINTSNLVNLVLFQALWFAAVLGSAQHIIWPSLLLIAVLAIWQLSPQRRHPSDVKLLLCGVLIGLCVDTMWIQLDLMEFTNKTPISGIAPIWIIALWAGISLTVNHSLSWLKSRPFLPVIMGMISAPLCYFAGVRFDAVQYLKDFWLVSLCLGIVWAIALSILVRLSRDPIKG